MLVMPAHFSVFTNQISGQVNDLKSSHGVGMYCVGGEQLPPCSQLNRRFTWCYVARQLGIQVLRHVGMRLWRDRSAEVLTSETRRDSNSIPIGTEVPVTCHPI